MTPFGSEPDRTSLPALPAEVRVELAHHWLVSMRGGEKVLAELADLFGPAAIHTLLARRHRLAPTLARRRIRTSGLQHLPAVDRLYRRLLPLMPAAVRGLGPVRAEVLICSDSALIKGLPTAKGTLKLCYCHTPMRSLWDQFALHYQTLNWFGRVVMVLTVRGLQRFDRRAARTVHAFIANSGHVRQRIARTYAREAAVIHPPVPLRPPPNPGQPREDYYLLLGEHVAYKRHELAIQACRRLGRRLVVIGEGPETPRLRELAGAETTFLGWQADAVVDSHLQRARALVFAGEEDFGMVPIEAMSAGCPVLAYRRGGATETVPTGVGGLFFDQPTVESLVRTIQAFEAHTQLWPLAPMRRQAERFSPQRFRQRFGQFVRWAWSTYRQCPGWLDEPMVAAGWCHPENPR